MVKGYYQVKMSQEKVREESIFVLYQIFWAHIVCLCVFECLRFVSSCLSQLVYITSLHIRYISEYI